MKTRTKLMLEGIGNMYRWLVGLDAICKGDFAYAERENQLYE